MIRLKILLAALLAGFSVAHAQEDPAVMTIGGQPVSRSEFEYSYNKNNANGEADTMSVDEYVNNFINYKLKVIAAKEEHLDTLTSFKNEFASYRDDQVKPTFINDADIEKKARELYAKSKAQADSLGGLVRVEHVYVFMKQDATVDEERAAKLRIDSIYDALRHGATFDKIADKYSDDKDKSVVISFSPWFTRGEVFKEVEDEAFDLRPGQMSKPFQFPGGWDIILLKDKRDFFPYDSLRDNIVKFIDQKGICEQMIKAKIDSISKAYNPQISPAAVISDKERQMETSDPDFKYLMQEYHDGLLMYEISNQAVWDKAEKDEAGLEEYFKKNKKKYRWDTPRFKGIDYHVKKKGDVEAVKNVIRHLPSDEWNDAVQNTFNKDSTQQVLTSIGLFMPGDSPFIDKEIFKKDVQVTPSKDYPIEAVYGKKLKKPDTMDDVRDLVVSDYQKELENEWVKALRKKYQVVINKNVLATVNKH